MLIFRIIKILKVLKFILILEYSMIKIFRVFIESVEMLYVEIFEFVLKDVLFVREIMV